MVDTQVLTDRLKDFVYEKFPVAKKQSVKNSDSLLDSGIIDSLGILDLVTFIENEFGVHVSDEELLPENFLTLNALAAFIQQKGSNGPVTEAATDSPVNLEADKTIASPNSPAQSARPA